jgi:hypothetical protein
MPSETPVRQLCARSVLGECGEVSFGGAIPAHPRDRVPPAALNLFERGRVRGVTSGDHLLEMPILGLDDVVCRLTLVLVVARPAELLACHRFHQLTAFFQRVLRS